MFKKYYSYIVYLFAFASMILWFIGGFSFLKLLPAIITLTAITFVLYFISMFVNKIENKLDFVCEILMFVVFCMMGLGEFIYLLGFFPYTYVYLMIDFFAKLILLIPFLKRTRAYLDSINKEKNSSIEFAKGETIWKKA